MGLKAEQNALKQLLDLNCVIEVDCMRQNDCEHNPLRERCETLAEFGDDGCVIRNAMRILKRSIKRGEQK